MMRPRDSETPLDCLTIYHLTISPSISHLTRLFALTLALLLAAACNVSGPKGSSRPGDAQIVASDIANFWIGFDSLHGSGDTMPLRRYYLDKGSVGLRDFTNLRWKNSATLTSAVWAWRDYYASIRANTLAVMQVEPQIRQVFATLDTLVPGSIFPDVYFAIGAMGTGGTTSNNGLLIGTELFSLADNSPVTSLTLGSSRWCARRMCSRASSRTSSRTTSSI